jgi:peptide/nickel transport system substrate-binding protein
LLTAADVVFSLNRARSNDPNFTSRSLLDNVDKIEAIGADRIRITAKRPEAPTLSKLSGDSFLIMAPEVVERANKFTTPAEAVGTGAFIITAVEEKIGAEYIRNPDYWKPGMPYLDGFQTKHFDGGPGNDLAWAAFLAGRLDAVVVPGTEAKKYIEQQGPNFTPRWYKDNGLLAVINPNTKIKPFDDPRVQRALKLLTDHEEFLTAWAATWFGQGRNVSMLPPSLDSWDLAHDEYYNYLEWKQPKDQAVREALSLLSAAGFTRSNPLKFEITSTISTNYSASGAELTQAQYRRLGQGVIETTLRTTEGAAYQSIRANRDYVFGSFTNLASFNEPDVNLTQICYTGASRNYWNYSDPKLDDMIDRQRVIFDVPRRKAAVREIVIYMIDTFPGVMGAGRLLLNATKPTVRDLAPEVWIDGRQYEKVWLDA